MRDAHETPAALHMLALPANPDHGQHARGVEARKAQIEVPLLAVVEVAAKLVDWESAP